MHLYLSSRSALFNLPPDFPKDCLEHVFSFVGTKEITYSIPLTCKEFQKIAKMEGNESFWENLWKKEIGPIDHKKDPSLSWEKICKMRIAWLNGNFRIRPLKSRHTVEPLWKAISFQPNNAFFLTRWASTGLLEAWDMKNYTMMERREIKEPGFYCGLDITPYKDDKRLIYPIARGEDQSGDTLHGFVIEEKDSKAFHVISKTQSERLIYFNIHADIVISAATSKQIDLYHLNTNRTENIEFQEADDFLEIVPYQNTLWVRGKDSWLVHHLDTSQQQKFEHGKGAIVGDHFVVMEDQEVIGYRIEQKVDSGNWELILTEKWRKQLTYPNPSKIIASADKSCPYLALNYPDCSLVLLDTTTQKELFIMLGVNIFGVHQLKITSHSLELLHDFKLTSYDFNQSEFEQKIELRAFRTMIRPKKTILGKIQDCFCGILNILSYNS